jgi:putative phosphotransacetylase
MAQFIIETSARHVHVTQETLEKLFGQGATLTVKKELSQPGQFASGQKVDLVAYKKDRATGNMVETRIKGVSILGPVRKQDQVELSLTDARSLGVVAPVRESGDVAGSGVCKLVGPAGEVELKEGVIAAKRHIHMTPEDASSFGVTNGQIVAVKVLGETGRSIIFGDTVIRVSPTYALAMHIDTDEANAGALSGVVYGEIIK